MEGRRHARRHGRLPHLFARGPCGRGVLPLAPQSADGAVLPHVGRVHVPAAGLGAANANSPEGHRGLRFRDGKEVPRDQRRGGSRRVAEARVDPGPARGATQDVEERVRHRAWLRVPARVEGELRRAGGPDVRLRSVDRLGLPAARHLLADHRAVESGNRRSGVREGGGRHRGPQRAAASAARSPGRVLRRPAVREVASLQAPGAGRGGAGRLGSPVHQQRVAG